MESEDPVSACHQLQAASNEAAAQSGKKLSKEQAASIQEAAGRIGDVLGCG